MLRSWSLSELEEDIQSCEADIQDVERGYQSGWFPMLISLREALRVLNKDLTTFQYEEAPYLSMLSRLPESELSDINMILKRDQTENRLAEVVQLIQTLKKQRSTLKKQIQITKKTRIDPATQLGDSSKIDLFRESRSNSSDSHQQHESLVDLRKLAVVVLYVGCPWLLQVIQTKLQSQLRCHFGWISGSKSADMYAESMDQIINFCGFNNPARSILAFHPNDRRIDRQCWYCVRYNKPCRYDKPCISYLSSFSSEDACYSILSCTTGLDKRFIPTLFSESLVNLLTLFMEAAVLQGYSITGFDVAKTSARIIEEPYWSFMLKTISKQWHRVNLNQRIYVFDSLLPQYQTHLWSDACRVRFAVDILNVNMANQIVKYALLASTSFKRFVEEYGHLIAL